jgi:mannose-6-phosphate isomerase-like protein (cupin superfamily)
MSKAAAKSRTARRRVATKVKSVRKIKPAPRPKAKSSARPKLARTAKPRPAPATRQSFTVSHLDASQFKQEGLRRYATYRDLGMAAATNGKVLAHVIRMIPPCTDEVRKRHYHDVDFQMVYVLKGWMKNEFEGQGEHVMREGSCWIQPARIRHTVLDYSDDCEVLEIVMPANFATAEV